MVLTFFKQSLRQKSNGNNEKQRLWDRERIRPFIKPKIFAVCPFTEEDCRPCFIGFTAADINVEIPKEFGFL